MVVARSDYGVVAETKDVTVDNSGGSILSSNAHIKDISLSPSSTFEPAEDEELSIKFDVRKDLDELQIFAVRGSEEIELYDEEDVDEENNLEVTWDGTDDDDEYVDKGSWRILFKSKIGSTELQAAKSIDVDYDKPDIDDLYLSKKKFDNELGEFTHILFRIEMDAEVTIEILEDDDVDDTLVDEMEVEKDKWYAVEWDGGSYDYDDDLDVKLIAANKANDNVYDTEKISIDLAEDNVSSSKSNVTMDYIAPVITDGDQDMTLYYDLEDDADVTITIHKGKTSSGTTVIELLDIDDQESGAHEIVWNGRNSSGNRLSKGVYTYKIVSRESSSETETGLFVVGTVGDIEGTASDGGTTSSTTDGKVSSSVISVDGEVYGGGEAGLCAGFSDVLANSVYCEAIEWAKGEEIFVGYPDGTFKPFQAINRVEILKIILEALNVAISTPSGSNLGFSDIETSAWYMPYIETAKGLGVFHGDAGKGTARPADTVNRAEALKFVFETLRVASGYTLGTCALSYSDVVSGAWYYNYACAAKQYDLFDGTYLSPANLSTRGEMVELLYKLHEEGLM